MMSVRAEAGLEILNSMLIHAEKKLTRDELSEFRAVILFAVARIFQSKSQ